MKFSRPTIFLFFFLLFVSLTSFSGDKYDKGSRRSFGDIELTNVSIPDTRENADTQEQGEDLNTAGPYDQILQKVIEENRYVEKLDSSSFFSLPVGISVFDGAYSLVVHHSEVHSDYAQFDAFLIITNPLDGKKIRFLAENVRYSFAGGVSSFDLVLDQPVKTGLFSGAVLEWQKGTYARWTCNGFDHIGLKGKVSLSKSKFVEVNPFTGDELGNICFDFFTTLSSINDFVLDVSFPAFKIKGFDEAYFEFSNAVLDFSDMHNASSFRLPKNYPGGFTGEMETLWRGVYVREANVYLSSKFRKKNQVSPIIFSASELILDDFGFTGLVTGRNILSRDEGVIGNWPFSVNELSIGFFTGSFQSFGFSGEVQLPGSSSYNEYSAFFDEGGDYHFEVSTGRNLDFGVFAADIELYSTSSIEVFIEDGKFIPTANLDGKITFACANSGGGNQIVNTPYVDFQGMRLSGAPPFFDVNYIAVGGLGEAKLAKFPITISDIKIEKRGELVGFGFNVNANLSPVDGAGINADGDFSILARISADEWRFEKLDIDYFNVDASKEGAFTMHGRIELFDNDPVYGDAFYGKIDASFADTFSSGGDLKLQVAGMFGNADFGRYFFVDAFIALGSASVPAPPFIINGFGGGLSYGMKRTYESNASGTKIISSVSGVNYLPDPAVGLGISAALQAGIVNETLIKGNINFGVEFNTHGGINQISFYGEAAMISPVEALSAGQMKQLSGAVARGETPSLETTTPMKASVKMLMNFQEKTFDADLEVWLNVAGVFKGVGANNRAGWASFHSEPGKWHLLVGTPSDPVGVEFVNLIETRSYFMAGHDLPAAMLMNEKVLQILGMTQADFNGQRGENELIKGDGLAFGTNFELSTGDLTFLIFYASLDLGAGFDIMLIDYGDYARCEGRSGAVGIDGWYARGQAYAYFAGKIGIKVKVFGRRKKFDIINLQTAAAMRLEGPNPTWMMGVVGGKFRILGGLVSGRCRFQVSIGDKCDLKTTPEELSDMTIISGLTPTDEADEVDIFTLPQAVFNMPVGKEIKVTEDEDISREFRINLNEYSIYAGEQRIEGEIEWNAERTTLAFTPTTILDPLTEYKAVATVSFDEKIDGHWQQYEDENGELYEEIKEVSFKTGELPDRIPSEYVDYSYPIDRMVNFYKNENPQAYFIFKADLAPFFYKKDGWEQKVRWYPVHGGTPVYADFTYHPNKKEVVTNIPSGLQNETFYRFELVNLPLSDNNEVDRNVSEQTERALSENESSYTDVTTRTVTGVISEQEEKVIYDVDFRTSKYNQFLDKIPGNELDVRFLFNFSAGIDFPGSTIYDSELFDAYEIHGGDGFASLIRRSAPLSGADWYQQHIYPLLYEGYPWHGEAVVERNTAEYGIPPQHPVDIWQVDYDYILTDTDIETGTLSNDAEFAHFLYVVPKVWASDFSEIRNNISQHISSGRTAKMEELLRRDIWPQVDMGNYPIKLEYVLPGKNKVTSSRVVNLNNEFDVPQIETFSEE